MDKKTAQSLLSRRPKRVSPVIKSDGLRLGTEDKVEVESYTWGDRKELSREVLEVLKESHIELLDALGAKLSLFLRAEVSLTLEDLNAARFNKARKDVDDDLHLNIFQADATTGAGFIGFDPLLALSAVNLLLGGNGDAPKEKRALTKIESELSSEVANEFLQGWKELWKHDLDFDPKVYQQVSGMDKYSQSDPHSSVLLAKIKMTIGKVEGVAYLLYPIHMVEAMVRRIREAKEEKKERAKGLASQWSPVYDRVPVRPEVRVPACSISVGKFLSLQPGEVIPLQGDAMDRACLALAGRKLFSGSFGVDGDRLALALKHKL